MTKLPRFHTKTVSFIAKSLQPLISSVKKIPSRQGSDIYPNLEQCKRLFFCPLFFYILLFKMKPFVFRIFFLWFGFSSLFRSLWQRNLNLGIFIWSIVCFHYPFSLFLSPLNFLQKAPMISFLLHSSNQPHRCTIFVLVERKHLLLLLANANSNINSLLLPMLFSKLS